MRSSDPSPKPTSITVHFADLRDPRVERTRLHPLVNVLTIALLGVICGAEGWDDLAEFGQAKVDWLATFLVLSNGTPGADTFRRVFCALRPDEFERCMRSCVRSLAGPLEGQVVAFDRHRKEREQPARTFAELDDDIAEGVRTHVRLPRLLCPRHPRSLQCPCRGRCG